MAVRPALEHAACPTCHDEGHLFTLCGETLEVVVPFGTAITTTACVVCWATQVTTCNRCNEEVTLWL